MVHNMDRNRYGHIGLVRKFRRKREHLRISGDVRDKWGQLGMKG